MNEKAERRGIYHGTGEVMNGIFVEHRNGDISSACFTSEHTIKVTVYRVGIKQEARLLTNVKSDNPTETELLNSKPIAVSFYNGAYIAGADFKKHGILEIRHEPTDTIFYEDWSPLGKSDFANLKK